MTPIQAFKNFHTDVMAKKDIEHPDGLYRQVKVVEKFGRTQDQIDVAAFRRLLGDFQASLNCAGPFE